MGVKVNLSNIIFNAALFLCALLSTLCYDNLAFAETSQFSQSLKVKKANKKAIAPNTPAKLKLNVVWQIIRSHGQGDKMGTSADTFVANGELFQSEVNRWVMKIGKSSATVSFNPNGPVGEGFVYIERGDLLNLLNVSLLNSEGIGENDPNYLAAKSGSIQLFISKNQNRQQDVIYRSPDEQLFLVKASLAFAN